MTACFIAEFSCCVSRCGNMVSIYIFLFLSASHNRAALCVNGCRIYYN